MAYEMVMPYHLHMPSYFLETFTEYPRNKPVSQKHEYVIPTDYEGGICVSIDRTSCHWRNVDGS